MALSIVAAANLTVGGGQFVAGYVDGEERGRLFIAPNQAPPVANSLPVTVSVSQTSIVDSAGNTKTGGFKVQINPNALDTTNASSPMTIYVDQNAQFIIASTNNG